jgi:hypothetical protein
MYLGDVNQRFGICWLFFGYTLALHLLDEAGHDFLSVYNSQRFGDSPRGVISARSGIRLSRRQMDENARHSNRSSGRN